jgi:hypothetical protein
MASGRYIPHNYHPPEDLDTIKDDILNALVANTRLVQQHTPDMSRAGGLVYVGAAGMYFADSDQHLMA